MMRGRQLPPAEECISCGCRHITRNDDPESLTCPHTCFEDVNIDEIFTPLACYTQELKGVVITLLRANRTESTANGVLDLAWSGFEKWAANTDDGQLYRDIFDDIWFRMSNKARIEKSQRKEGVIDGRDVLFV